jgi:hypothetical protein
MPMVTESVYCPGTIFCAWFNGGMALHQAGVTKRPGKDHYRYYPT